MLFLPLLFLVASCGAQYLLDDSAGLGRAFDGVGAISGGGATSKLLVNYPEKERNEILDYLFKPNFGASLHILKVEIGGDIQSTEGTESSHMHERWDENYHRGYEWWLMKEAKKRNPAIKLHGLSWGFPGWVGRGSGSAYKYPNDTATYIVKWILGAKQNHFLDIDCIGIWNERQYDVTYVKVLKSVLLENNLNHVKVVVADSAQGWDVAKDIFRDPEFAKAVDVIGAHYPGMQSTEEAVKTGKALWAAEDYSTYNDDVGAGCQAKILNRNYVQAMITSTIAWNLVASYYSKLPYGQDGLMTANEPWSGHYVVTNPIWVTAHTTQFTQIGWTYLNHGSGVGMLNFGGSYVTLISPDRKDFTIIIETMTFKNSECIRPDTPYFNVTSQQAEFFLQGALAEVKKFNVWKTDFKSKMVFVETASIEPALSSFRMLLEPDQVYTVTTLNTGVKGAYEEPPKSKSFPLSYNDDFESYEEYAEAFNFVPQSGVWEVRMENKENKVNRQVLLNQPIYWCFAGNTTVNTGGDYERGDTTTAVNIFVPSVNGTDGVFLGARISNGGCETRSAAGVYFTVYPHNSTYAIYCTIERTCVLSLGTLEPALKVNTWYKLAMIVKDQSVSVFLDDQNLVKTTIPKNIKKGFIGYGTTTYGVADFDNYSLS